MGLEILITNDDGYASRGIAALTEIASRYGNVTVLAPLEGQSGKSVALTLNKPLYLKKNFTTTSSNGTSISEYTLNGTPADCVKMALNTIFPQKKPDLILSGINHGSNAALASLYSGTLGACIEGTLAGIQSLGFSLEAHGEDADLASVEQYLPKIIESYIQNPAPKGIYLNINFPDTPIDQIMGIKLAAQGQRGWIKEFTLHNDNENGDYYLMSGEYFDNDNSQISDHKLLNEGYITIVPHKTNNTDYDQIANLTKLWNLE